MATKNVAITVCSKCGKKIKATLKNSEKLCDTCKKLNEHIIELEQELLAQDFTLEQEDEKVAIQIDNILKKDKKNPTYSDKIIIKDLIEKLIFDDTRKSKILEHIIDLQENK